MKTSSAKAKGRRLQQWVRDKILEQCPRLTKDDVRSTGMGQTGADVLLSSAGKKLFPVSIECKNLKKHSVYRIYEQAISHIDDNDDFIIALGIIKENEKDPLAVIDASLLFVLLGKFFNVSTPTDSK